MASQASSQSFFQQRPDKFTDYQLFQANFGTVYASRSDGRKAFKDFIFPVQLITSRIGNLTQLVHTLATCVTIHTHIVPFFRGLGNPNFSTTDYDMSLRL